MALYGNLLFYPATDAKLYALDARTGKIVWQIAVSENAGDKIGGITAFGEPLADRCDQLASLPSFPLLRPEATEAYCDT